MSKLQITTETIENATILRLSGAATFAAADEMQKVVTRTIAAQPARVIVDLAGLEEISSLFAGQLIALSNGLKHHNGRAAIVGPARRVREALERMRIGLVLPIFGSLEEALAQTGSGEQHA